MDDPMRHRSARLWRKWDDRVSQGENPVDFIPDLSDESIMELLMSGGHERRYEKDILLTEALNRMRNTQAKLERVTDFATRLIRDTRTAAEEGAQRVRDAEDKLGVARDKYMEARKKHEEAQEQHRSAVRAAEEAVARALEHADDTAGELEKFRDEVITRARGGPRGEQDA